MNQLSIITINDTQYDESKCVSCPELLTTCKNRKYKYCDKNLIQGVVLQNPIVDNEVTDPDNEFEGPWTDPKLVRISEIISEWINKDRAANSCLLEIKDIIESD